MKTTMLVILTALLLFSTACSGSSNAVIPTDNFYHPETDYSYYTTNNFDNFNFAQTDNGYYFLLAATLFYADDDAMELIPVCAKPECPHYTTDDQDIEVQCNANFHRCNASNVFNYNGQIYVFHKYFSYSIAEMKRYVLTRISADGSRQKTILALESEWPVMAILHRGVFYIVTQNANEQGQSVAQLWEYPLDNQKKPQLLYETEAQMITHNLVDSLRAYGNYLYVVESAMNPDMGETLRLRILDLNTNEWTLPEDPEGYTFLQAAISNGRLVRTYTPIGVTNSYRPGEEKPNLSAPMFVSDLDGSNVEQIAFDSWGKLAADEAYIYLQAPRIGQVNANGSRTSSISTDSLYFYDTQMNLLDELPLGDFVYKDRLYDFSVYPTRGDKILLFARQGGYRITLYYINRSEIGTGNITPVEIQHYGWTEYFLGGTAEEE